MSKTNENLKAAFAGESQANRRYLVFAKKAEKEGINTGWYALTPKENMPWINQEEEIEEEQKMAISP